MGRISRPAVRSDLGALALSELLNGDDGVAGRAEAPDVGVDVSTALGERPDVIRHGRGRDLPVFGAASADRLGLEAA